MEIVKCYVLDTGNTTKKRVHIIKVEGSLWYTPPTLNGAVWNYRRSEYVIASDFSCSSEWLKLIGNHKGCLATCINLDNGRIILL